MTINAAGLISWTPTVQQEGTQVVTVVVYDPEGLYGSQNFTIQGPASRDLLPPTISPSLPGDLVISTAYHPYRHHLRPLPRLVRDRGGAGGDGQLCPHGRGRYLRQKRHPWHHRPDPSCQWAL